MFPNILPQAGGNAGGLLWAGLLNILKLFDRPALAFGMDEAVNAIHFKIPVAFVNHVFIGTQTERRKNQPARQRMGKRIERESNQPAKQRINEAGPTAV